jgi:GntR family transcriptional regulator/MocR family aminotransferase
MRDPLFQLPRSDQTSLQSQVREMMVSAILDGRLPCDEPVPSSRRLARTLGVSRNTIVLAYQGLVDDGYLIPRERSGYFVNADMQDARPTRSGTPAAPPPAGLDWAARIGLHPSAQENLGKPRQWDTYEFPFIYGQVDHTLFPMAEWRDCARQALGRRWLDTWTGDAREDDDPALVEQVRSRILPRRGIMASDDEILITLGAQNALYILASLLVTRTTRVAMEDPGYPDVRNIFRLHSGGHVGGLSVDDGGLVVDDGLSQCDLVFVTPSHQFPTTVTMPVERRVRLLERATRHDFLVIEDDYEFETSYRGEPSPALKSLDRDGRVVYVGSLSKTMFPGLRLGFLVAPAALIREARALRRLMVRHPPSNNQRTAALFLALGHHDTLIHRLHRAYHARWQAMAEALGRFLPESTRAPTFGGTSFWVRGPAGLDADRLASRALERGIIIEPGRIYFGDSNAPRNYFRLGFSSIPCDRIAPGIARLAGLIDEMRG